MDTCCITCRGVPLALVLALIAGSAPVLANSSYKSTSSKSEESSIYKTVDAKGQAVFTDTPSSNATKVVPSPINVLNQSNTPSAIQTPIDPADFSTAENPDNTGPEANLADKKTVVETVTSIQIVSPVADSTLQDPNGPIWVKLKTAPISLKQSGLRAQLWMDDQMVQEGKRNMISMPVPDRGTHIIWVSVVDKHGKHVVESAAVQFHVKRQIASNN